MMLDNKNPDFDYNASNTPKKTLNDKKPTASVVHSELFNSGV